MGRAILSIVEKLSSLQRYSTIGRVQYCYSEALQSLFYRDILGTEGSVLISEVS